mmetsp:Transcript_13711/g.46172  ORF Transcript_13711/g.46172 Transcript_13711/m.46172 type:complete len:367 (+) Transcript_13711:1959-3059(+)
MDGAEDGAAGVGEAAERAHEQQRRVGVEACGRLVEEEDGGRRDELDADGDAPRLPARDTSPGGASDPRVGHLGQVEVANHSLDSRLPDAAGLSAARQAEFGGVCEHLAHSERLEESVELHHVRGDALEVRVAPLPVEQHLAGDLAPVLPVGEHVEEGGLAAAGGPHDGRERPRREDARHAAQHVLLVPVQRPLALALWQRSLCARAGRCVELDGVVYVGEGEVDTLDALGRLVRALEGRRARRRRLGEREAFCGGPGRCRRPTALRSRTREPDEGEPGVREEEDEADHDDRRDHLALEPRRPRILRLVDALVEAEVALRNINIGRNGDLDVAREVRGAGAKAGKRQPAVRRRRRVCHFGLHRVIER